MTKIVLSSLLVIQLSFGQIQRLEKINTLIIVADMFLGNDGMGAFYYQKESVFYKQKGEKNLDYKNLSLGKITNVDIQNPLKLVLFYENFNTIITLDNQLNEIQKINFSESEVPINAVAVGIASQNQFWVFNSLNQQIGLFDGLKKEYKTISTPISGNMKYYQSDFNNFRWIDEKNNWYSIDIFGKITNLGKIPEFNQIEFIDNQHYFMTNNNHLYFRDTSKNDKIELEILEKTIDKFSYKNQILTIFTDQQITNYKIKVP